MVHDVRERPLTYNQLVVPCSALTVCDRSVVLILDDRPDPQLWGHCKSTHNSSRICLYDRHIINLWFTLYLCSFSPVQICCIFHYFSHTFQSFNGFFVTSWWVTQHGKEKPLSYRGHCKSGHISDNLLFCGLIVILFLLIILCIYIHTYSTYIDTVILF